MLCGMMRAVDSSVANMTAAYKRLGLWQETVVIFSTESATTITTTTTTLLTLFSLVLAATEET